MIEGFPRLRNTQQGHMGARLPTRVDFPGWKVHETNAPIIALIQARRMIESGKRFVGQKHWLTGAAFRDRYAGSKIIDEHIKKQQFFLSRIAYFQPFPPGLAIEPIMGRNLNSLGRALKVKNRRCGVGTLEIPNFKIRYRQVGRTYRNKLIGQDWLEYVMPQHLVAVAAETPVITTRPHCQ